MGNRGISRGTETPVFLHLLLLIVVGIALGITSTCLITIVLSIHDTLKVMTSLLEGGA